MTVRVDLNGLLSTVAGPTGLAAAELEELADELARIRTRLAARRTSGALGFAELPARRDDVRRIRQAAAGIRGRFDTLVVLGTGGCAPGARALLEALTVSASASPHVVVADSIDPERVASLLATLDLRRTLFNVVSKSGDTAETVAQFLIVRDRLLHQLGAVDYKQHVLLTTDAERGPLRQIVNDEGFRDLVIPAGTEGRFAVLTAVGLFPAAVAGIDIEELLAGAALVDERGSAAESPLGDPGVALAGTLTRLATHHGVRLLACLPYSDRLAALLDWFCQLWVESAGPGRGLVPVRIGDGASRAPAVRAVAEGPRDAAVLFVRVDDHGVAADVPAAYQDLEDVSYLGGHPLGALVNAEQRAAEIMLARAGCPTATVLVPVLNPFTVGQLVYLLETAAVAAGALAGIDPCAPAGLDEPRRMVGGLLGRPGLENAVTDAETFLARKDLRFVL